MFGIRVEPGEVRKRQAHHDLSKEIRLVLRIIWMPGITQQRNRFLDVGQVVQDRDRRLE
jgi:hypothetical protein